MSDSKPIQVISTATCFTQGAGLWVTESRAQSKWTRELDWLVNLQISNSEKTIPQKLSETVLELIKSNDLHIPEIQTSAKGWLIPTHNYLPNRWIYVQENPDKTNADNVNLDTWLTDIIVVWKNLGKPSLRIFIDGAVSEADFQKSWSKTGESGEISLVLNQGH